MKKDNKEIINLLVNNSLELNKNIQVIVEKKLLVDKIICSYMKKKELIKIDTEDFLVEVEDGKIKIIEKN